MLFLSIVRVRDMANEYVSDAFAMISCSDTIRYFKAEKCLRVNFALLLEIFPLLVAETSTQGCLVGPSLSLCKIKLYILLIGTLDFILDLAAPEMMLLSYGVMVLRLFYLTLASTESVSVLQIPIESPGSPVFSSLT